MKQYILSSLAALLFSAHFAQAAVPTTLDCEDGFGGPGPASAILKLEETGANQYAIALTLKNPSWPNRLQGQFTAEASPDTGNLFARGNLVGAPASMLVEFNGGGDRPILLSIQTSQETRIELGYGLHFVCKAK